MTGPLDGLLGRAIEGGEGGLFRANLWLLLLLSRHAQRHALLVLSAVFWYGDKSTL